MSPFQESEKELTQNKELPRWTIIKDLDLQECTLELLLNVQSNCTIHTLLWLDGYCIPRLVFSLKLLRPSIPFPISGPRAIGQGEVKGSGCSIKQVPDGCIPNPSGVCRQGLVFSLLQCLQSTVRVFVKRRHTGEPCYLNLLREALAEYCTYSHFSSIHFNNELQAGVRHAQMLFQPLKTRTSQGGQSMQGSNNLTVVSDKLLEM